jgi:endonuclease G
MRPLAWLLACAPAIAVAGPTPVVGGENAPSGKWPDVAAVLWSGQQACTGTLIAPTVVITAGHCNDPSLTSVLIGTNSLAHPEDGETITVQKRIEYPSSQSSIDVTVLVLDHEANEPARAIASGWARLDIQNGAAIELVGYGAIDVNGNNYIDELQQAETKITDSDCTASSGCNLDARPDGELGAGGMGIDTCSGDSGGPLYLLTDYGTYVAGVTSRSYDNATSTCGQGGIYERPDKIVDWIEQMTGVAVQRGPEPAADPIMAIHGDAGETQIEPNDPKSTDHNYAITTPPAHGTAKVRDDGRVRVCTDPSTTGPDSLRVMITDASDGSRALALTIPITVEDGVAPAACDVDAFSVGAGCCDAGGNAAGSLPLAACVLFVLRRRRSTLGRGRNLAQV